MKKLTALFLSVAMCGTLLAGCGSSKSDEAQASDTNETTAEETTDASSEEDTELLTGLHHVTIDVKDYGTISLELDADTAPISVTNFINLAKDGFTTV